MASLTFSYGAMNSGKSADLLRAAHGYEERGGSVLITKPSVDTKGDTTIVSRAIEKAREVHFLTTPEMNIREEIQAFIAREALKNTDYELDCVFADEAQFLQPLQVEQLLEVTKLDNIPVMAYGIRTDFQARVFPGSLSLFEKADRINQIVTICRCKKKAQFNGRKDNGVFVFEGSQIAIDGEADTTYEALCGNCYLTEKAKALAA